MAMRYDEKVIRLVLTIAQFPLVHPADPSHRNSHVDNVIRPRPVAPKSKQTASLGRGNNVASLNTHKPRTLNPRLISDINITRCVMRG